MVSVSKITRSGKVVCSDDRRNIEADKIARFCHRSKIGYGAVACL